MYKSTIIKRIRGEPSSGEMSGFGKMSYKVEQRKLLPTLCNMGVQPSREPPYPTESESIPALWSTRESRGNSEEEDNNKAVFTSLYPPYCPPPRHPNQQHPGIGTFISQATSTSAPNNFTPFYVVQFLFKEREKLPTDLR